MACLDKQVVEANVGNPQELYLLPQATRIPEVPDGHRDILDSMGRLVEDDAVDPLLPGVKQADDQAVRPGSGRPRDVERERGLAALVGSYEVAIEPNLGQVIRGAKANAEPLVLRRSGRVKLSPVPDHPVIGGKGSLQDIRHRAVARPTGGAANHFWAFPELSGSMAIFQGPSKLRTSAPCSSSMAASARPAPIGSLIYQCIFMANCTTRGASADVSLPKALDVNVATGVLKFTWLKTLKNSARNCKR